MVHFLLNWAFVQQLFTGTIYMYLLFSYWFTVCDQKCLICSFKPNYYITTYFFKGKLIQHIVSIIQTYIKKLLEEFSIESPGSTKNIQLLLINLKLNTLYVDKQLKTRVWYIREIVQYLSLRSLGKTINKNVLMVILQYLKLFL